MEKLLLEFFRRLEAIGAKHPEVTDTDVLDAIAHEIEAGFLRAERGYKPAQTYAMFSWRGDRDVTRLVEWFVPAARAKARIARLNTFHKRLAAWSAFKSKKLDWTANGVWVWDASAFDEAGNPLE